MTYLHDLLQVPQQPLWAAAPVLLQLAAAGEWQVQQQHGADWRRKKGGAAVPAAHQHIEGLVSTWQSIVTRLQCVWSEKKVRSVTLTLGAVLCLPGCSTVAVSGQQTCPAAVQLLTACIAVQFVLSSWLGVQLSSMSCVPHVQLT